MKNKIEDLQYNPDGTIDLKWFNSIPKDDQIMLGGKWTAEQFAVYNSKKTQLRHDEILNPEIEEYIEDCIETALIETEKFGTEEYFLGRNEDGAFMVVAPYYDDFYKQVRHLYLEVDKTGVTENYTYDSVYDEYEYKSIRKEEYQIFYKIYIDGLFSIIKLFEENRQKLDRNTKINEVIWDCYGSVFQIKGYGERGYQARGYYVDGIGFDIRNGIDKIREYPYLEIFDIPENKKHYIITEEAFLKGYEIAKNTLDEIKNFLENLYL